MRASTVEHERQLEAAIALREKEIAQLNEQKSALQSQLVVSTPALRCDPLLAAYPVLDYVGKKAAKNITAVPLEQAGNIVTQLGMAKKAIDQQNHRDTVEVKELRRRLREQEKRYDALNKRTTALASECGIDPKYATEKMLADCTSLQHFECEMSVEELQARKRIVQKEVQSARVIAEKKGKTITELRKLVDQRKAVIDEIDSLYNSIRVADRDTVVVADQIEELGGEHDEAVQMLEDKKQRGTSAAEALIEQDVADLKNAKQTTVSEGRIPQERVVKAQDYRLGELEKRLKAIEKALSANRLKRDVEKIVASNWSRQALEVPDNTEELYDIDRIIPAQEKVHPGIYNLFLTEKERTTRTVSVLNITTKEKEEAIAALVAKQEALCQECTLAIQQLDELASGAAFAEEQQRNEALRWVREQRAYYDALFQERQQLLYTN